LLLSRIEVLDRERENSAKETAKAGDEEDEGALASDIEVEVAVEGLLEKEELCMGRVDCPALRRKELLSSVSTGKCLPSELLLLLLAVHVPVPVTTFSILALDPNTGRTAVAVGAGCTVYGVTEESAAAGRVCVLGPYGLWHGVAGALSD
jgi:hypothetical protein